MQHRSFARVAVMKIKITKINSEGLFRLFTKFSTLENYPPYSNPEDTVDQEIFVVNFQC